MIKTALCIALVLSVAQGSQVLDLLKKILEEQELQERGVYKVSKTSTSISGTIQIDINDCPKPEDGCVYVVTASNTRGNDAKTMTQTTGGKPVQFTFTGLEPSGAYEVTACTVVNGQYNCGPKVALCDMRTRSTTCSYSMAKRDLQERGVMEMVVGPNTISGNIMIDTRFCPKPMVCDYEVTCRNPTSGDGAKFTVKTKEDGKASFTCSGLTGGEYQVTACKDGVNTMCGPRMAKCNLSTGKCSMKYLSAGVSVNNVKKNAIIEKIEDLLEEMKQ